MQIQYKTIMETYANKSNTHKEIYLSTMSENKKQNLVEQIRELLK